MEEIRGRAKKKCARACRKCEIRAFPKSDLAVLKPRELPAAGLAGD